MLNPRIIYTCVLWLLLPYVFFHLLWRGRKQTEYFQHIPERFGFFSVKSDKPVIWLHTVSVGETRAAASLIQQLSEAYPNHQILLSHTTSTGRATSTQLYGDKVMRVYLPYDYPFAVKRFLKHFKPSIGILLETEIWFNLIQSCKNQHIPLLLLNARLSEKSARSYSRFPKLIQQGLSQLHSIAAQTDDDAQRLSKLGAEHISVMGNLKYDIAVPHAMLEQGEHLRDLFGKERNLFLAASTREGEEVLILEALSKTRIDNLLTIIVPRHPQRFDEVAALLTKHNIRFQRRSENIAIAPDTEVVLGDSMGEMFAYFAACDLTFIGGSLLPFGGQNLIEACAVGKPVLIGPHTYNFAQVSQLAIASGAAKLTSDTATLANTLQYLFAQPDQMQIMGHSGLAFVRANQGATGLALELLNKALSENLSHG